MKRRDLFKLAADLPQAALGVVTEAQIAEKVNLGSMTRRAFSLAAVTKAPQIAVGMVIDLACNTASSIRDSLQANPSATRRGFFGLSK